MLGLQKQSIKLFQNRISTSWVQTLIAEILKFNWNYPKTIIAGFTVVFVACFGGASQITLDKNIIHDFPEDSWLRVASELVESVTGGTQSLQVFIDMNETDALKDPEVLNKMNLLQEKLLNI